MAELWLVCEGEPGSVDIAVLNPEFRSSLPCFVARIDMIHLRF
jgi:hypothetical protein